MIVIENSKWIWIDTETPIAPVQQIPLGDVYKPEVFEDCQIKNPDGSVIGPPVTLYVHVDETPEKPQEKPEK